MNPQKKESSKAGSIGQKCKGGVIYAGLNGRFKRLPLTVSEQENTYCTVLRSGFHRCDTGESKHVAVTTYLGGRG